MRRLEGDESNLPQIPICPHCGAVPTFVHGKHPMQRHLLFDQLTRHAAILRAMLNDLLPEEQRWKPAPDKWCALEVICHLYDEEREDFRARLEHVLATPDQPMPPIDPAAWVAERRYMEQDFGSVLMNFFAERERSVIWLRGLDDASWGNAYMHPKVGPVSCALLLTNWVAHDLHHIRQLLNLRYGYLRANSTVPMDYAGTW
jgi:hypothetical protein